MKQLWQVSCSRSRSNSAIKGRVLSNIVEPAGMSLVAKSPLPAIADGRTSTLHSNVEGAMARAGACSFLETVPE
jgi:hypothetical protein